MKVSYGMHSFPDEYLVYEKHCTAAYGFDYYVFNPI
jgi:hypothetical protein